MTEREERILNLVIELSMTRYEVAVALIEAELKREARLLIKERREVEVEKRGKGQ